MTSTWCLVCGPHHGRLCSRYMLMLGFPGGASGKEHTCQCKRCKRHGFDTWAGKIPWRRAQQPTPIFLPGESHGQETARLQSIGLQRIRRGLKQLSMHTYRVEHVLEHLFTYLLNIWVSLKKMAIEILGPLFFLYLFIWLHWVLAEALRIFNCSMQTLSCST